MKNNLFYLKLDICSYWRAGAGQQAGAYADQLVIKQDGLPYLPGKQLRGVLKKAFKIACDAGWLGKQGLENIDSIFGNDDKTLRQGVLQVSNAQLLPSEINWFTQNPSAKPLLYHTKDTQAVEHISGTTKQGSLRTMEVTVPVVLFADISLNQEIVHKFKISDFEKWLIACCSLITAVGADRNRGMGQVVVSLVKSNQEIM